MSFAEEVDERIRTKTLKMLKDGDPIDAGINGQAAEEVLEEILQDTVVIEEVADDSGLSKGSVTKVFNSLLHATAKER